MKFFTPALLVATLIVLQQVESNTIPFFASSESSDEYEMRVNRNLRVPMSINAQSEMNQNRNPGLFDSFKKIFDSANAKVGKLDPTLISQAVDKVGGLVDTVLDFGKKEDTEKPKEESKKEEKKEENKEEPKEEPKKEEKKEEPKKEEKKEEPKKEEEPKKDEKPAEVPAPEAPKPEEQKP